MRPTISRKVDRWGSARELGSRSIALKRRASHKAARREGQDEIDSAMSESDFEVEAFATEQRVMYDLLLIDIGYHAFMALGWGVEPSREELLELPAEEPVDEAFDCRCGCCTGECCLEES